MTGYLTNNVVATLFEQLYFALVCGSVFFVRVEVHCRSIRFQIQTNAVSSALIARPSVTITIGHVSV